MCLILVQVLLPSVCCKAFRFFPRSSLRKVPFPQNPGSLPCLKEPVKIGKGKFSLSWHNPNSVPCLGVGGGLVTSCGPLLWTLLNSGNASLSFQWNSPGKSSTFSWVQLWKLWVLAAGPENEKPARTQFKCGILYTLLCCLASRHSQSALGSKTSAAWALFPSDWPQGRSFELRGSKVLSVKSTDVVEKLILLIPDEWCLIKPTLPQITVFQPRETSTRKTTYSQPEPPKRAVLERREHGADKRTSESVLLPEAWVISLMSALWAILSIL